jgi:hypothetical protein
MSYVHELNKAMHDKGRFDAVVARLAVSLVPLPYSRNMPVRP